MFIEAVPVTEILLIEDVTLLPVIFKILSNFKSTLFKLADKGNPVTFKKAAVPTTIPSLLSSTLASKVGVLIVIAPPAATAKVLTVADNNSSPVIVIGAEPVVISSP